MGYGFYSSTDRLLRATTKGFTTKAASEIFTSRNCSKDMNPHGVKFRESRDSTDHPNSVPIIVALDVTGSMGTVPHFLVKEGLPHMMQSIMDAGVPDPQVLFLGIGDHECDNAPLQAGQFESNDELLDRWLTDLFIEGGGGGNIGESYLLAWMFASKFTRTDHNEKRGKKGLLFTIGDEPTLKELSAKTQKALMGEGQFNNTTATELLDKAREKYEVFHIHITETGAGKREKAQDDWKQLMGDNVLFIDNKSRVAETIAKKVAQVVKSQGSQKLQALIDEGESLEEKFDVEDMFPLPSP